MHITCVGRGSLNVILDAASGALSANWVWVQQEVSGTARVCAYDRAGMGWSKRSPEPRDAKQASNELHALLEGAGIVGAYVLTGHSYGGLCMQTYAARYPHEVAGVAVIESAHPEQFSRLPEARDSYEQTRRLFAVAPLLARLGVVRLFDVAPASPNCPSSSAHRSMRSTLDATDGCHRRRVPRHPQSTARPRGLRSLGRKPLAVVSADEQSPAWLELQDGPATLSSNNRHHVVEGDARVAVVRSE